MKLKKIILNNIRSYENQEINFSGGSTLLSGDIGSGKTSILLGIEFALFGLQPGQRGSSLLRNGKNFGSVITEFEINGREIAIERNLKKGRTISQDSCFVTIDGNKTELSVMELKSLVLEFLNYPRELSKKQNLLYRFTVYTPQEEMKQIINEDPEIRTNTLRYIFGVEKYKQIIENTGIVSSKIREQRRILEGSIINAEDEKQILALRELEIQQKAENLNSIQKNLFAKSEEKRKIQEEKDLIENKIDEIKTISREIEKINLGINHKNENISNNLRLINQIKLQLKEFENVSIDERRINSLNGKFVLMKSEKEKISENLISLGLQISSLKNKNLEGEEVKNRILHIEICPTCMQKVDLIYKNNILKKIEIDFLENQKKIEQFNKEKEILNLKFSDLNFAISKIENELSDLALLKIKMENIEKRKGEVDELENLNIKMHAETEELKSKISVLEREILKLKEFEELFEKKKREFDTVSREERILEINVAEFRREIQLLSIQILESREKIKKSEETKSKINYLVEIENWLSTDFVTLVSTIEKNIMIKLKSEFSRIFSEWFSMLVSENFNVYVRDDFTPVIEIQDYEIDYAYLSGGERTAIALAYRLALNQLINSVLSNIETKDIVILDEPTDGFSDQQLDKMRDVLNQLNVKQLIIVSHEQKIEGFVENIIRVKKENSTTIIQ